MGIIIIVIVIVAVIMGGYVREEGGGDFIHSRRYTYGTISPQSINQPKKPKIHGKIKKTKKKCKGKHVKLISHNHFFIPLPSPYLNAKILNQHVER